MKRCLTPEEKAKLKQLIDLDQAIPSEFLPALFPDGDGTVSDREKSFEDNTKVLRCENWTALPQMSDVSKVPSCEARAAWAWRREIWHVHFGCVQLLHRAHRAYTTGWYSDANEWNDISRILLRYGLMTGALALHNGFEDRIAQLANAFLATPCNEDRIHFVTFFREISASALPNTRAAARRIIGDEKQNIPANPDWKKTHTLANEVKHRWTGEFVPHLEKPADKLARLRAKPGPCYEQPGLTSAAGSFLPQDWKPSNTPPIWDMTGRIAEQDQKAMANLDGICEMLQKSQNTLVNLVDCLDAEIDWPGRGLQPML